MYKFFCLFALIFIFSFFPVLLPGYSLAHAAGNVASELDSDKYDCNKKDPRTGMTFNEEVAHNRSKVQQNKAIHAINVSVMFPITNAMNQCVDNLMKALKILPRFGDPFGLAMGMLGQMLASVIMQDCSQIVGAINMQANNLLQYTRICMPMPEFDPFQISVDSKRKPCDNGKIPLNFVQSLYGSRTPYISHKDFQGEAGKSRLRYVPQN